MPRSFAISLFGLWDSPLTPNQLEMTKLSLSSNVLSTADICLIKLSFSKPASETVPSDSVSPKVKSSSPIGVLSETADYVWYLSAVNPKEDAAKSTDVNPSVFRIWSISREIFF